MKIVTLPGLFDFKDLNLIFIKYYFNHSNQFVDQFHFICAGNTTQNAWTGHRNFASRYFLHDDIETILLDYRRLGVACRFDCGNLLFNKNDYNVFNRALLKIGDNGSNQIEVSTADAYHYFKEKYPNYQIVGSEFMIDFHKCDDLFTIVRNQNNPLPKDFSFNKNKIENILFNPCDSCSLETWSTCIGTEHSSIDTFSNKCALQCEKFTKNPHLISYQIEKMPQRFQFIRYPNQDAIRQLEAYISVLVKPEYQNEVRTCIAMQLNGGLREI